MARNLYKLVLYKLYLYHALSEAYLTSHPVYFADGGGAESPIECILGGQAKFEDETYIFNTSGCEKITETRPFRKFDMYPTTSNRTDTTRWCPISDPYNAKSIANPITKRHLWGYCLEESSTISPSINQGSQSPVLSPTSFDGNISYFADGAGVGFNEPDAVDEYGYQPCVIPFSYVADDGEVTEFSECASIDQYTPFHSTNTFPDPPTNPATDTTKWCAINNHLYDLTPNPNRLRKDWGYCLEVRATKQPTTSPTHIPSVVSTTHTPTMLPTCIPISSDTVFNDVKDNFNLTSSPVPSILTQLPRYYGVGGGLRSNESMECVFPFRLEGQDNCWYNNCITFNESQPWGTTHHKPDSLEHHSVDLRKWCPVSGTVYDINSVNRSQWGFCSLYLEEQYHSNNTLSPTSDSGGEKTGAKLYFPFLLFLIPALYYMVGGMKKI